MAPTTVASVVIPCFNARQWIGASLESVRAQGLDGLEVILVDDGSTDGSPDLIRETFPFVRVVRTANRGPSHARNVGTSLSSGTFVQYLDADDLLVKGKIRRQIEAMEATDADVAYGDWQELRPQPDSSFAPARTMEREIKGRAEIALFTDFWCPPAAYLFRRSIIEQIGGWNEKLPIIQDARFALDCALHGGRFVYCPGVSAIYRIHTSGSVSTRDPVAFVRDCFANALDVERWWGELGGLDDEQRRAVRMAYEYVARSSFERDRPTFDAAYRQLRRLDPRYVPTGPRLLAVASGIVGYPRAEKLAATYRQLKRGVASLPSWFQTQRKPADLMNWIKRTGS